MKSDAGQNQSIWTSTADIEPRPPLAGTEQANVCIVGAGIAGLTTAYLLAREGMSVAVLDDGPIAGGETGRTTAHLSNALDDRYAGVGRISSHDGSGVDAVPRHPQEIPNPSTRLSPAGAAEPPPCPQGKRSGADPGAPVAAGADYATERYCETAVSARLPCPAVNWYMQLS